MIEPTKEHRGEMIYGIDQNPVNIPNPYVVKPLDKRGNFIDRRLPKQDEIISQYWAKNHRKIALLLIVSAGILMSILIQETDLLNFIFGNIADQLIGFFMGLIF